MEKVRIEQHSFGGLLWVFAMFIWPFYLGAAFRPLLTTVVKAAP